jgi:hypothetical protein
MNPLLEDTPARHPFLLNSRRILLEYVTAVRKYKACFYRLHGFQALLGSTATCGQTDRGGFTQGNSSEILHCRHFCTSKDTIIKRNRKLPVNKRSLSVTPLVRFLRTSCACSLGGQEAVIIAFTLVYESS